jgi:hypothetical protein
MKMRMKMSQLMWLCLNWMEPPSVVVWCEDGLKKLGFVSHSW